MEQMKVETLNTILDKALTKKDGIYSYQGNYYLVINKHLFAYSDYFGNVSEICSGFSVCKGKSENRFEARKVLKDYLKQL